MQINRPVGRPNSPASERTNGISSSSAYLAQLILWLWRRMRIEDSGLVAICWDNNYGLLSDLGRTQTTWLGSFVMIPGHTTPDSELSSLRAYLSLQSFVVIIFAPSILLFTTKSCALIPCRGLGLRARCCVLYVQIICLKNLKTQPNPTQPAKTKLVLFWIWGQRNPSILSLRLYLYLLLQYLWPFQLS